MYNFRHLRQWLPILFLIHLLSFNLIQAAEDSPQADSGLTLEITKIEVNGESIYLNESSNIRLPFKSSIVEITYHLSEGPAADASEYWIMLEGFEDEWRYNHNHLNATYTNLAAGDYRFKVRALTEDTGVAFAEIGFTRVAHPLLSPYAYFLYFALIVLWLVMYTTNHQRQIRAQKVIVKREQALAKGLRDLSVHLEQTREEERAAVARELHDELAQVLVAIKLEMNWIESELYKNNMGEVQKRMPEINKTVDACVQAVRNIAMGLRPSLLDDMGLVPAMNWYLTGTCERASLESTFATNCEDLVLSKHMAINMYRIVQESVSNVIKHSGATKIEVSAILDDDTFTISIKDNGIGLKESDKDKVGHYGLMGIRERVANLDGSFETINIEPTGLMLKISIPV